MSNLDTDWVVHPSETVLDLLDQREESIDSFLGANIEQIEWAKAFLMGIESINESAASRLSEYLGGSESFWIKLQEDYSNKLESLIESDVKSYRQWLSQFNYNEISKKSWLPKSRKNSEKLGYLFSLFEISDLGEWDEGPGKLPEHVAFRRNKEAGHDNHALSAWIAISKKSAMFQNVNVYDHSRALELVPSLRELVLEKDTHLVLSSLKKFLACAGIRFVLQDAPAGCYVSGAVVSCDDARPLIILTTRYKTDDQFWFSFFHELGHVLLHDWREGFIDSDLSNDGALEAEANSYAQHLLVPMDQLHKLIENLRNKSAIQKVRLIMKTARSCGVTPGVVVGQLQHHKSIPFSHFNKLKNKMF
ncbi:ImmA/IrrE family metallo-endopeptidase [Oceanicaulis sp.]|uniref:ImmA/IrrE family metallo-endopeptidase n=1 Tax=Oceanicaulis sp. TaxID=1924941 RepID=UPI003BABD95F